MPVTHHRSPPRDIDPVVFYGLLKLRADVFIVEQECAYPDLDGRDVEPGAVHHWSAGDDGSILATLRVLEEADGEERRIGRVATAMSARGQGLAGILMERAVAACQGRAIHLDAQSRLEGWYARYGFVRSGDDFLEDDIVHVPMTRATD